MSKDVISQIKFWTRTFCSHNHVHVTSSGVSSVTFSQLLTSALVQCLLSAWIPPLKSGLMTNRCSVSSPPPHVDALLCALVIAWKAGSAVLCIMSSLCSRSFVRSHENKQKNWQRQRWTTCHHLHIVNIQIMPWWHLEPFTWLTNYKQSAAVNYDFFLPYINSKKKYLILIETLELILDWQELPQIAETIVEEKVIRGRGLFWAFNPCATWSNGIVGIYDAQHTEASHQRAIEMLWLQVWKASVLSVFIYCLWAPLTMENPEPFSTSRFTSHCWLFITERS